MVDLNRLEALGSGLPPEQVAEVTAIACELPRSHELPLSRFSRVELHR